MQTKKAKTKKQTASESEFMYLGISDEAKTVFDAIAASYPDDIRVALDFATLAIFADSVVKLEHINRKFGEKDLWYKTPKGTYTAHPVRDEKSMLQKQIHYCSARLGLTPDARNKIKLDLAQIGKSETTTGRKPNKLEAQKRKSDEIAEEFCE